MIKLKSAEDIVMDMPQDSDGWQSVFRYNDVINAIKEAQRNAIEYALKGASENADADVYFHGWLAEESMKSGEPFVEGEDYEVYVINSSIIDLKETIFKDNNL